MKRKGWLVTALVIVGVVFLYRSCERRAGAHDEQLAAHLDAMCDIARAGAAAPVKGVKKLGRYLAGHADDMLGNLGGMFATIERIDDDDAHDERARLSRERLAVPLRDCEDDWERFIEAVDADEEATEITMRAMERLNRTLDILLTGARLEWKTLPRGLRALLATKLR